jgi:hypothetical protein
MKKTAHLQMQTVLAVQNILLTIFQPPIKVSGLLQYT